MTLWLFETSLKYLFIIIEFFLMATLFILSNDEIYVIKFKLAINILHYIDILVVFLTFLLFALSLMSFNNFLTLVLGIFISFFGLGYALLRVFKFHPYKSKLEWFVLSFWLSIPINCLIYSLVLILPIEYDKQMISLQYFIFTFLLLIILRLRKKDVSFEFNYFYVEINNLLLITIVIFFFITSIAANYPDMVQRPGLDIVRSFTKSQQINLNPQFYKSSYPWYHFQLSSLILFYEGPREIIQTTIAFLSVFSFLSFYVLSKAYLDELDRKLAILSTVLWSLFSGFGWLYFFVLKLCPEGQFDLLRVHNFARRASFQDIGYGQGSCIWLWFRPLTLGITGFFILLYLLRRKDLSSRSLLSLTSFSIFTLGLLHYSELVFYVGFLFMLCVIFSDEQLTLRESSISSLIGLSFTTGFVCLYQYRGIDVSISTFIFGLTFVTAALALLVTRFKLNRLKYFFNDHKINFFYRYIVIGFMIIWISMLFYWYLHAKEFLDYQSYPIYGVPWLLYPTLIGVCGLLTFHGINYLFKEYSNYPVLIFIIIFIYGIILGRVLTYININFMNIGYWESRIIPLTFSSSSILASIPLLRFLKKLNSRPFIKVAFLSLIIFSGLNSTLLTIEHQILLTSKINLTKEERKDIEILSQMNLDSQLLTFSTRSFQVSEYVPFNWRIEDLMNALWSAKSPEFVLDYLFSTGYPATIYLKDKDIAMLSQPFYSEGYLIQHLIKGSAERYNNIITKIYDLTYLAPPVESSDVVLILPEDDHLYLFAFDMLSLAGFNYTTASIADLQTIRNARVVIVTNENLAMLVLKFKEAFGFAFNRLIILNLDGDYGEFSDFELLSINASFNTTKLHFGNVSTIISSIYFNNETRIDILNLGSIIKDFGNDIRALRPLLKNITIASLGGLSSYNIEEYLEKKENTMNFENAILVGNITVSFNSIIIHNRKDLKIKVIVDGIEHSITPNTLFTSVAGFDEAILNTNYSNINPGKGYYLKMIVDDTKIFFSGLETSLITYLEDGSLNIFRGNKIIIKIEGAELFLRKPIINVDGKGEFKSLYTYRELHERIRSLGNDCKINGIFSFAGIYGDTYSICNNCNLKGNVVLSQNLYEFDEFKYFINIIPYIIPTLIMVIVISLIIKKMDKV